VLSNLELAAPKPAAQKFKLITACLPCVGGMQFACCKILEKCNPPHAMRCNHRQALYTLYITDEKARFHPQGRENQRTSVKTSQNIDFQIDGKASLKLGSRLDKRAE
jgi:hypothetical protein